LGLEAAVLVAALLVSSAVVWGVRRLAGELRRARDEGVKARSLELAGLLGPAAGSARSDPRVLLDWQPLIRTLRRLFPEEWAVLDGGGPGRFPVDADQVRAAHAQWTSNWLAWERAHDAEYKLKAAVLDAELTASGGAPPVRARLEAIEREKLELYQRRYEEYVRVAKALQALAEELEGKAAGV
jgi:hypothetical protein